MPIDLENLKLKVNGHMAASLLYDASSTGQALRNLPVKVEEMSPNARARAVSDELRQQEFEPAYEPQTATDTEGFGMMDFSLLEDLWGDSIWVMFDPIAPSGFPTYSSGFVDSAPHEAQHPYN
jgi:hypothetical protein